VHASDDLIVKSSAHSVEETLDRLEAILKKKGLTIFIRIDHAAGATKAGMDMKPTQVLLFGNPKLGTPLMLSNRRIGIDLPIKVLAWQDEKGAVWLAYNKADYLKDRHAIADRDPLFDKMKGVLGKLTDAVITKLVRSRIQMRTGEGKRIFLRNCHSYAAMHFHKQSRRAVEK